MDRKTHEYRNMIADMYREKIADMVGDVNGLGYGDEFNKKFNNDIHANTELQVRRYIFDDES